MTVDAGQALAWRLERQYLTGGAASFVDVVRRLGALMTWSADPELSVGRRLQAPGAAGVARALRDGQLIRTWSFRGAVHVMEPSTANDFLVVRCAGRQWELRGWIDYYQLQPTEWPALREVVREVLEDGPLSPERLGAEVSACRRFRHLAKFFDARNTTFLKPFAWQGDIVIGPGGDGELTVQAAPEAMRGRPALDDAGRAAVIGYLDAYGPAGTSHLQYWLGEGLSAGKRRVAAWIKDLAGELVEVDVGGDLRWHLARHEDGLKASKPTSDVLLLPGHDQWVMGPGTADPLIMGASGRRDASRGAPLVVAGGRVCGTWKETSGKVVATFFPDAAEPARSVLAAEAGRLSAVLGRPLEVAVQRG